MLTIVRRLGITSTLILGLGMTSSIVYGQEVHTAGSGYVAVPATGRICYDSSCAVRVVLSARIPPKATIVGAVRYYTTAGGPDGDVPMRAVQPGDIGWSLMEPAIIKTDRDGSTIIEAVYYNRSHNRSREAAIEVDWK